MTMMVSCQLKLLVLLALVCAPGVRGAARPRRGLPGENRLAEPFSVRRMRRSAEERERCARLRLCRLHARAARSPLAAFRLYFVNRETARLWDHAPRSRAECERRFSCDR